MLQQNDSQQRTQTAQKTHRTKIVRQRGSDRFNPRVLRLLRQQLSEDEYAYLESTLIYRQ